MRVIAFDEAPYRHSNVLFGLSRASQELFVFVSTFVDILDSIIIIDTYFIMVFFINDIHNYLHSKGIRKKDLKLRNYEFYITKTFCLILKRKTCITIVIIILYSKMSNNQLSNLKSKLLHHDHFSESLYSKQCSIDIYIVRKRQDHFAIKIQN